MKVINVNYNGPSHGRKNAVLKLPLLKKNWNKEYLKNSKIAPNTHFRKKKSTLIFETWVITFFCISQIHKRHFKTFVRKYIAKILIRLL